MIRFKRTISFYLSLLLTLSLFPSGASSAAIRTRDEALAWTRSQEGQVLDYDGAYGAQCVDLIMYYYQYLGFDPYYGNGCDYATDDDALRSGWSRIAQAQPEPGDILVYTGTSLNPCGHVAIYESDCVRYSQDVAGCTGVVKVTSGRYDTDAEYWGVIRPVWLSSPSRPVTVTFTTSRRQSIGETDATLACLVQVDGAALDSVSRVGLEVYQNGQTIASKMENAVGSGDYLDLWYPLNSALNCWLTKGTDYQYRFYAVVNGTAYSSELMDFTTTGAVNATVTFDPTGGAVSPGSKTVDLNGTYGELPVPTRTGYSFSCWSPDRDGEMVRAVGAADLLATSGNHTLYAHWIPNTYTVTFDPTGGRVGRGSQTVRYNRVYSDSESLPVPTRGGFIFTGWYTSPTGGTLVTDGTNMSTPASHTLYARWRAAKQTYTVFLDAAGGTLDVDRVTLTQGEPVGSLPSPVRPGYTFLGWYTSGGSRLTEDLEAGPYYTPDGSTLHARWREGSPSTAGLDNFKTVNDYYNGMFQDVDAGHWFAPNVATAYQLGLLRGTGNGIFEPGTNMTVAQAVTLAARLHRIYHTGEADFPTYDGGNWYDPYVDYARQQGIVTADHQYSQFITREEFAHILARALPAAELQPINGAPDFADRGAVTYQADVELLFRAGVVAGISQSGGLYFKPLDTITRGEVAAIATRMVQPGLRVRQG